MFQGLDKAIRELMPNVEHRFCTRHLVSNLTKVYSSQMVKDCFWTAATATHPRAFKLAMKELERASKGAADKMKELDPSAWSKAYFSTHSMTDSTDNNMSECFNSWILRTRYMPIIDMLTEIHDMLMTRVHQKRDWMDKKDCIIVPTCKKCLIELLMTVWGIRCYGMGRRATQSREGVALFVLALKIGLVHVEFGI